MPCTKDDSNKTATTHEHYEENITFNLEEENNYTKNEVSSIVHDEPWVLRKMWTTPSRMLCEKHNYHP
mgnify:CR=1 FL=1